MNLTKLVGVVIAVFTALPFARAQSLPTSQNPYLKHFTDKGVPFELHDYLRNPAFTWPRTLLTYEVDFTASPIKPEELVLTDSDSGQPVPLQVSQPVLNNGQLIAAKISFFTDLASGAHHAFDLHRGASAPAKNLVTDQSENGRIELDNGVTQIRLPSSAIFAPGDPVHGPITSLKRGGDWMGESRLVSGNRAVQSLSTERIESGPLFVTYRMTYQFTGGGSYVATVRAIAGYDYAEFKETMTGLNKEDGIYFENAWTAFHPTNRKIGGSPFGVNGPIDKPIVQPFRGEDPAFTGPSRTENLAQEMLPDLSPYWPNGWGGNRYAAFVDEKSGRGIGLFVTDASKWQDHDYAIWTSAETLKVKYRFADGVLYWKWPLATGTRETGITIYQQQESAPTGDATSNAEKTTDDETESVKSEADLPADLCVWYADISLDRVKDWVLQYPEAARRPTVQLAPGRKKSVQDYMQSLPTCAMTHVTQGMFHPVELRDMGNWVVPGYNQFEAQMTPDERSQASAYLLFAAYVSEEEEFSPIQNMLGGHPNFMTDLKFPMAAGAFLFPDHPMAQEWREKYEKFIQLCGHFYVRPPVPEWQTLGGRFTESIATYNWAFIAPSTEANFFSMSNGGHNVYATPEMSEMGDYIVGILTAPVTLEPTKTTWPDNTPLTWDNQFKRIHPPQGAHSSKRGAGGGMYTLGEQLQNFSPLTSEHLLWGSWPSANQGFEDRDGLPAQGAVNHGTNPHLTSAKYTGYGFVLRSGVDTPDEVTVYLQQLDKGPNYRWGYGNQNGCGDIYYYAGGHSYSGHEREEAGDGHVDDAMLTCNTGVYKDWHFSCVGMNELTRPLYDSGVAQFAEIVPDKSPAAYSWPEYQSRSVMLVGTDYFVTYDQILDGCGTRFAWAISKGDDMPIIHQIRGAEGSINLVDPKSAKIRGTLTTMIKGGGSHMALITNKENVEVVPTKRAKGEPPIPYEHIRTPGSEDFLFQDDDAVTFSDGQKSFSGKAGIIRFGKDGETELALFHGSEIGAHGVTLAVDNPDTGISARFQNPNELSGNYLAPIASVLTLQAGRGKFYVDGAPLDSGAGGYTLPPGNHRWELTEHLPEPMPPVILRTENHPGGANVFFTTVASAASYRVEVSTDSGLTWKSVGQATNSPYDLQGLPDGTKVHVRVIAINADREGRPANEYPIYVSSKPPASPDGLKCELIDGQVKLTWGEVLGPTEYRLYRRELPDGAFAMLYHGMAREFTDTNPHAIHASDQPGLRSQAIHFGEEKPAVIDEYAVSAANVNGVSAKSSPINTDPASWLNWNPDVPLKFKRQSQFWLPPWVPAVQSPPLYYPGEN